MKSFGIDFAKAGGLVPVVVQKANHRRAGKVLMVAYANEDALHLTIETGIAHFWSRSRKKIWKKGEISGNTLNMVEVLTDCDSDALIYRVRKTGPVCHTGKADCFFQQVWKCEHDWDYSKLELSDRSPALLATAIRICKRCGKKARHTWPRGDH